MSTIRAGTKRMRCPFCLSSRVICLGRVKIKSAAYSKRTSLVQCAGCDLSWIDPLPDERKLSRIYAGVYHYNPSGMRDFLVSLYTSLKLSSDYKLIRNYKRKGKVIDIGAGRGDFLLRFKKERWERWVYDPFLSRAEVDSVKEKIGPRVNNFGTLEEYPGKTFDVVVLRNVIEHTRNFQHLLKESFRTLKRGGVLFVRTPNIDSLDFKQFKTNWYVVTMPGHIVFFGKKSLSKYLSRSGFRVKFNQPERGSAVLSFFRSSTKNFPGGLKFFLSILYSLISPFLGEGGDFRAIAEKKRKN